MVSRLQSSEDKANYCLALFNNASSIEYNYYALYVYNDQVCCICAIWNRILYCFFGQFGCFLGEAGTARDLKEEQVSLLKLNALKQKLILAYTNPEKVPGSKPGELLDEYYDELVCRATDIQRFACPVLGVKVPELRAARALLLDQLFATINSQRPGTLNESFCITQMTPPGRHLAQTFPGIAFQSAPSLDPKTLLEEMPEEEETTDEPSAHASDEIFKQAQSQLIKACQNGKRPDETVIDNFVQALKALPSQEFESPNAFYYATLIAFIWASVDSIPILKESNDPKEIFSPTQKQAFKQLLALKITLAKKLFSTDQLSFTKLTEGEQIQLIQIAIEKLNPAYLQNFGGYAFLRAFYTDVLDCFYEVFYFCHSTATEKQFSTFAKKEVLALLAQAKIWYTLEFKNFSQDNAGSQDPAIQEILEIAEAVDAGGKGFLKKLHSILREEDDLTL